jgi:hypothetical protein
VILRDWEEEGDSTKGEWILADSKAITEAGLPTTINKEIRVSTAKGVIEAIDNHTELGDNLHQKV